MNPFGERLAKAMAIHGPLCLGIDPGEGILRQWGLPLDESGLREHATRLLDAADGVVSIVKPQSAFFERFGARGVATLEWLCAEARARGFLVILDAKRGDIGSTNAAYAEAYLGEEGPVRVDAMTVSPYLGFGSLQPFLDVVDRDGAGIFVLVRTSNPEGASLQTAQQRRGRDVAQALLDDIASANSDRGGVLGSIGMVFGATISADHYALAPTCAPILAPGLGAQGATPEDLRLRFGDVLTSVVPTASRSVTEAGPAVDDIRCRLRDLAVACRKALTP